jgi:hypothetical protein
LIHLAGYVADAGLVHAALYFVRNIYGIATTGEYIDFRDDFQVSEDYWSRHRTHLDVPQYYFNGFPDGRISYVRLLNYMQPFLEQAWNDPNTQFRAPRTLQEAAEIVRVEMQVINGLFLVSDYTGPLIGGDIQTELIAPPAGDHV